MGINLLGKYELNTFAEILNFFNNYNDAYLIISGKFGDRDNNEDYDFIQNNFNSLITVIDSVNTNLKNRIIPQVYHEIFYNAVHDIGYFPYIMLGWVGHFIDWETAYSLSKNYSDIIGISASNSYTAKNKYYYKIILYTNVLVYFFTVNNIEEIENKIFHKSADGFFSDFIFEESLNSNE